jgi:hypothetical protein
MPNEQFTRLDHALLRLSDPARRSAFKIRDQFAEEWSEDVADYIVSTILLCNRLDRLDMSPEDERDVVIDNLCHDAYELFEVLETAPGSWSVSRSDVNGGEAVLF